MLHSHDTHRISEWVRVPKYFGNYNHSSVSSGSSEDYFYFGIMVDILFSSPINSPISNEYRDKVGRVRNVYYPIDISGIAKEIDDYISLLSYCNQSLDTKYIDDNSSRIIQVIS